MILFIHGFASCGLGNKSKLLIEYFGQDQVLTPDLSHTPEIAIEQLNTLCSTNKIDLLVGSSLGGFYATWLSNQHGIASVLINPAVKPYRLLDKHIGIQKNGCNEQTFNFTLKDAEQLSSYEVSQISYPEKTLVLLETADEVLNYQDAENTYKDCHLKIEEGGSHRFESLQQYLSLIADFRLK